MKGTQLTDAEVSYLLPLLKSTSTQYSESCPKHSYIKALHDVSKKLEAGNSEVMKPKEKSTCIGCINEDIDLHRKQLGPTTVFTLLNLSVEQCQLMQAIDHGKDLLQKLGYYRKNHRFNHNTTFRYRSYLSAIEKLRNCNEVALSSPGENDYSKIGFVTDDALHAFRFRHGIGYNDLDLHPFHNGVPEGYTKIQFKLITSRTGAFKLLSEGNPDRGKILDFVMAILKN